MNRVGHEPGDRGLPQAGGLEVVDERLQLLERRSGVPQRQLEHAERRDREQPGKHGRGVIREPECLPPLRRASVLSTEVRVDERFRSCQHGLL